MPDISRSYVQTLPSITRVLFLSSLSLCVLLSVAQLPFLRLLPSSVVRPLQSLLHPFTFSLPGSLAASLFSSAFYVHLHRLVSPFILYPLLLPPTFVLSCLSLTLLAVYSRAIEEEQLYNAAGAAQYSSALAFAATFLLSFHLLPTPSLSSSPSAEAGPALLPFAAPTAPYFSLSLSLLMFVITLYTSFAPYAPLSFTALLLQWQSVYVLAAALSIFAPPLLPSLLLGILSCYAYHFATTGAQRVWGRPLWATPQWLVNMYERWGIGERRLGFTAQEGGRQLGGEEH